MSDRVTVKISDGIADVRMNRPDKLNAIDGAMFAALADTAAELADDTSLRCVVLSGEGRSFCAGLDFASFSGMANRGGQSLNAVADVGDRITHLGQQAAYGWRELPVPVIAAVWGHALGGGIQIALGADIRYVTADAKLAVAEVRWGIIPDMTGTQTLIELVGLDVAKELVFTGRDVSGAEAVELGLCTHLSDDPLAAAFEMADQIATRSPGAVRAAKRLLNGASKISLADGFAAERAEIGQLIGSPNQVEQITASFEGRPPKFTNP